MCVRIVLYESLPSHSIVDTDDLSTALGLRTRHLSTASISLDEQVEILQEKLEMVQTQMSGCSRKVREKALKREMKSLKRQQRNKTRKARNSGEFSHRVERILYRTYFLF